MSSMSSVASRISRPGARGSPGRRAASKRYDARSASAIGRESRAMVRASSGVKSPVASVRCMTTHPHARPRVTIAARISKGVPIGARYST